MSPMDVAGTALLWSLFSGTLVGVAWATVALYKFARYHEWGKFYL